MNPAEVQVQYASGTVLVLVNRVSEPEGNEEEILWHDLLYRYSYFCCISFFNLLLSSSTMNVVTIFPAT